VNRARDFRTGVVTSIPLGLSVFPFAIVAAIASRDAGLSIAKTLGMSLPYSSSIPADDPLKHGECLAAGEAVQKLLKLDLKPRDIMTREAFESCGLKT